MAVAQYVLSQGRTHYAPLGAACILTLVLSLLPPLIRYLSQLPHKVQALSFLPSALFLGLLTNVRPDIQERGIEWGNWAWGLPLSLILYIFLLKVLKRYPEGRHDKATLYTYLWPNLCILTLILGCVGFISRGNDVFDYELRMIRLVEEGRYEEALQTGKKSEVTSYRLTALRMYALAQSGRLPDGLFGYAIVPESRAVLPLPTDSLLTGNWYGAVFRQFGYRPGRLVEGQPVEFLNYIATQTKRRRVTGDYLLCAQLLDKDLSRFANTLPAFYDVNDSLPMTYKEALLLYADVSGDTACMPTDTVTTSRYAAFKSCYAAEKPQNVRRQECERRFGNTYCFFYNFVSLLPKP